MNGMLTRPSRPTTTVRPLKKMERPAKSTVVISTASLDAAAGAQLLAEPADHEQRVVDADGEAEQRGDVHREDRDVQEGGRAPRSSRA